MALSPLLSSHPAQSGDVNLDIRHYERAIADRARGASRWT